VSDLIECPKCGHPNSKLAYFCKNCHAILIHRCPNCWHEQREGILCEKCGTNMVLASEATYEKSVAEDARIESDKATARALTAWQIALLPFTGLAGVLRLLVMKLLSLLLQNR
jgi:uncharacterized membrane protein YvbJ